MSCTLELMALEAANPLAFLSALGVLRTLERCELGQGVRLSWTRRDGWRPTLHFDREMTEQRLVETLTAKLAGTEDELQFNALGDDLTVPPAVFRQFALQAAAIARPHDRVAADFAAAFGCEATKTDDDEASSRIQDTALRTMAGAGHQHFVGFMRNIIRATKADHIRKSLFEPWRYDDSVTNLTLRWDPVDDVRYALRWSNPSGDKTRKSAGSVLGANRLAIEGMPMLPTMPQAGGRLATTGFRGRSSRNTYWTWPVWSVPATADTVRVILSLEELQADSPRREELQRRGIDEVYRSQRLTIGKVKNFTAGQSV